MRYLSLDWIGALSEHVADSAELAALANERSIGVTQVVTEGPEGTVVYHLQVGDGAARFGPGAAEPEDVRMEQAWDTAVDVATGKLNAQEAFISGKIVLSGDQQKLIASTDVFAALDRIFADVRQQTDYR